MKLFHPCRTLRPAAPSEGPQRVAASPMRGPRGGKLPQMGSSSGGPEALSSPLDEYVIKADAPNYGGRGNQIDITESTGPMTVRPRESLRNGPRGDPDSPTFNPLVGGKAAACGGMRRAGAGQGPGRGRAGPGRRGVGVGRGIAGMAHSCLPLRFAADLLTMRLHVFPFLRAT